MKLHIVLQALSSLQAYTDNLRIYEKIERMEQGKFGMWRFYYLWNSDKERLKAITYLNPNECSGMSMEILVMGMEQ